MCGRFTLRTPTNQLLLAFALDQGPPLTPRFNIAPTQQIAGVRARADGGRELALFRWGLIPSWAKDEQIGNRTINARAESVAEKPSFRAAFQKRRCLILADGYYEWQKQGVAKQPFFIHRADDRPFAFAGLWERWQPMDRPAVESCTILTTEANEFTRPIHDRMPVILLPRDYDLWLDPAMKDRARLEPLLRPYPEADLAAMEISTKVNNPRNEGPDLLAE